LTSGISGDFKKGTHGQNVFGDADCIDSPGPALSRFFTLRKRMELQNHIIFINILGYFVQREMFDSLRLRKIYQMAKNNL
jgi:hypothetical protein